jgi:hypothetical protein
LSEWVHILRELGREIKNAADFVLDDRDKSDDRKK